MKNRVSVDIGGQEFTFLVVDEQKLRDAACLVDLEIRSFGEGGKLSDMERAILCAMNLAERTLDAERTVEHLKTQLKSTLEDAQKAQREAAEVKRELSRKKQNKESAR